MCRAATINETKALAIPYRARNHAAAAGARNLILIDARLSSRSPRYIMTFFNDQIDIHHIFPQAWCKKRDIPPAVFNSIVNKTPLSKASNASIGGDAPSVYLRRIEEQEGVSPILLDDILRSHLIEPEHLRNDDFDAFFDARMRALSEIVANAMGKPVVPEAGEDETERDIELEDDEIAELEAAA